MQISYVNNADQTILVDTARVLSIVSSKTDDVRLTGQSIMPRNNDIHIKLTRWPGP